MYSCTSQLNFGPELPVPFYLYLLIIGGDSHRFGYLWWLTNPCERIARVGSINSGPSSRIGNELGVQPSLHGAWIRNRPEGEVPDGPHNTLGTATTRSAGSLPLPRARS